MPLYKRTEKKHVGALKNNMQKIQAAALRYGKKTPAGLALGMLKTEARKRKVRNYIKRMGEEPMETPAQMATQALLLRNGQIQQRMNEEREREEQNTPPLVDEVQPEGYEPDPEDIEDQIMEEEAETFGFDGEADNFLDPATLSAVKLAGQKGLNILNAKREKKGKQPIFSKVNKKLAYKLAGKDLPGGGDDTAEKLKKVGSDLVEDITDAKKKEEIKKMMPTIVVSAIVLLLIGAGIAYAVTHKSK